MSVKRVTETALELMTMANGDIKGIEARLHSEYGFEHIDRILSAAGAQIAVEKILKGYLKHNKIEVNKGHDLTVYYKQAFDVDKSFSNIKDNITNLNRYDADFKYTSKSDINDNEFIIILKDIKKVYNFPPFQKIYDEFIEKGFCKKIPIERFDKMIEVFENIVNKDKTEVQ